VWQFMNINMIWLTILNYMQYAICNMQYAICNMQYAICNMQYAICNMQYASLPLEQNKAIFLVSSTELWENFNIVGGLRWKIGNKSFCRRVWGLPV
jgi:hypothetical protein